MEFEIVPRKNGRYKLSRDIDGLVSTNVFYSSLGVVTAWVHADGYTIVLLSYDDYSPIVMRYDWVNYAELYKRLGN